MKNYFKNQIYLLIIIDLMVVYYAIIEGDPEIIILLGNLVLGITQLIRLIKIFRIINHTGLVIYLIISILLIVSVLLFNNIAHILMIICFSMAHFYLFMLYRILTGKEIN